jgi:hypothetical protein
MITRCSDSIQQRKPSMYRDINVFKDRCSLEARARTPSSDARKVYMTGGLAMHEFLLGSRWIWPPLPLMDHYMLAYNCSEPVDPER